MVPVATLNRQPPALVAGERWQMTLRLKAPHGARNPGGFDYELWLWEQGVQATGYVRAGAKDAVPLRLGTTWHYPVAWARQTVRDAIYARIDNRQQAGLIAALVVGDQAAIDRADWDVFRATGRGASRQHLGPAHHHVGLGVRAWWRAGYGVVRGGSAGRCPRPMPPCCWACWWRWCIRPLPVGACPRSAPA